MGRAHLPALLAPTCRKPPRPSGGRLESGDLLVTTSGRAGRAIKIKTFDDYEARLVLTHADLADRLEKRVTAKLSSRPVLNVVVDLFGAGFETTRLLFIEDDPIGDGHDDD